MRPTLISGVSLRAILGSRSIFRIYQDRLIERFGLLLEGDVIEIGADPARDYGRFCPNTTSYLYTDLERRCEERLDVSPTCPLPTTRRTDMSASR